MALQDFEIITIIGSFLTSNQTKKYTAPIVIQTFKGILKYKILPFLFFHLDMIVPTLNQDFNFDFLNEIVTKKFIYDAFDTRTTEIKNFNLISQIFFLTKKT